MSEPNIVQIENKNYRVYQSSINESSIILPSESRQGVYYIFRSNGLEREVIIMNNKIISKYTLLDEEQKYFEKYILKQKNHED
jgi:hypothetical protein